MKWIVEVDLPPESESEASDEETIEAIREAVYAILGGWADVRVTKLSPGKDVRHSRLQSGRLC